MKQRLALMMCALALASSAAFAQTLPQTAVPLKVVAPLKIARFVKATPSAKMPALMLTQGEGLAFPDVPREHWAFSATNRLGFLGIMEGDALGRFNGNAPLTRYEFAVAVARLFAGDGMMAGDSSSAR